MILKSVLFLRMISVAWGGGGGGGTKHVFHLVYVVNFGKCLPLEVQGIGVFNMMTRNINSQYIEKYFAYRTL